MFWLTESRLFSSSDEPKITQSEVARVTGIGLGQVQLVILRLEKAGYLIREPRDKQEQPLMRNRRDDSIWSALPQILADLQTRR